MKLIWWILRNFSLSTRRRTQLEEVAEPQVKVVEGKQPSKAREAGTYEELCEFCNMIRCDEGFSLKAVHGAMFVDGLQTRHFIECPLAVPGGSKC